MKKKFKLSEYSQCSKDFVYFCNKYIKIKDENNKIINFNLYDFQRNTIDSIEQNYINIIVKARQMGFTTLFMAYSLWNMLFKNNFNIYYIFVYTPPHIIPNALEIFEIMYNNIPNFLQKDIIDDRRNIKSFSNGSTIYFIDNNSDNIGLTVNLLLVDEAQYMKNLEDIFNSLIPAVHSLNGRAIFYSSPSPKDTFFKKLYYDEVNSFNKIQIPWFFNRSRTQKYYDNLKNYIGMDLAKHELDAKF